MRVLENFLAKVRVTEGCWLWDGLTAHGGYGKVKANGKTIGAHRLSWEIHHGEIPDGQCVLHKCDVPLCVNPDHLFLGTNLDNIADRHRKGRDARGETSGRQTKPERTVRGERVNTAKLTAAQVTLIRKRVAEDRASMASLAREYHVSPQSIQRIIDGRSWKHLLDP